MKFITDRVYKYETIAEMIAQKAKNDSLRMIGITGTSSIGKSTFTRRMKEYLEKDGYKVQVIQMDDYLKEQHRAKTQFWNRRECSYLKPEFFDWTACVQDLNLLNQGICVEKECYVRGIGWGEYKQLEPADYFLVEGLFLDSIQAAECMEYDYLISLKASDELITQLRTRRDARYRRQYKNFRRTESETKKEIADTLLAGRSYQVCKDKWNLLTLHVLGGYKATVQNRMEEV